MSPTKSKGRVAQRLNQATSRTTNERQILGGHQHRLDRVLQWRPALGVLPVQPHDDLRDQGRSYGNETACGSQRTPALKADGTVPPEKIAEDDDTEHDEKSLRRNVERDPDERLPGEEQVHEGLCQNAPKDEEARRQEDQAEEERDLRENEDVTVASVVQYHRLPYRHHRQHADHREHLGLIGQVSNRTRVGEGTSRQEGSGCEGKDSREGIDPGGNHPAPGLRNGRCVLRLRRFGRSLGASDRSVVRTGPRHPF